MSDEANVRREILPDGSKTYSVEWDGLVIDVVDQKSADRLAHILAFQGIDWHEEPPRPTECERCGQAFDDQGSIMSMFNDAIICRECKEIESHHKDYQKACRAERQAAKKGLIDFKGIGLPADMPNPHRDFEEGDREE